MRSPPINQDEIDARIAGHLDELLALWWAEQGASKPKDLELIASAIPFARDEAVRVLDLCCGPGDVGRAIRTAFPKADIDGIDRDPFLTAICRAANRRERVPGMTIVRDLQDDGWADGLSGPYDAVATVNALHWFDAARAERLIREVHDLLRPGGVFLFAEPCSAEPPFAAGFEAWKERRQPRYSRAAWERFWFRANEILGYDHIALLGSRDGERIDELSVTGWLKLIEPAGFAVADVLLRDADQVIVAAAKAQR
ncbi:MAG: class I SAM-dependent methyltransferase [Alphaproteobacteria bacterium]|nr:class I SAM-dependent methyltransferase [Alphaproteobacteria bacterium]MBL7098477.1 class I SAM-dependent methyltransferase [Alphaproteobacteria bacterium]